MLIRIEAHYDEDWEKHFETVGNGARFRWRDGTPLEEILIDAMDRFPDRHGATRPVCRPARDNSGDWIVTDSPNATVLAD